MALNGRGLDCSVCDTKINRRYDDVIECSKCKLSFHLKCVKVEIADYHCMASNKVLKDWSCVECTNITSQPGDSDLQSRDQSILLDGNNGLSLAAANRSDNGELTMELDLQTLSCKLDNLLSVIERGRDCDCKSQLSQLVKENLALKIIVSEQSQVIEALKESVHIQLAEIKDILRDNNSKISRRSRKVDRGVQVPIMQSERNNVVTLVHSAGSVDHPSQMSAGTTVGGGEDQSIVAGMKPQTAVLSTSSQATTNPNSRQKGSVRNKSGAQSDLTSLKVDHHEEQKTASDWKKVERRHGRGRDRLRDAIVGVSRADKAGLRVVPKKAYLHVTRLHPDTTGENVKAFLKSNGFDVECEAIRSKFPEFYSSFKVAINLEEREKVMNANLWPKGAYVTRFFLRRKDGIQEK